jgi:hypothetical protein
MKISLGRYYLNRKEEIVKVISPQLKPFEMYVALADPENPRSKNLYYVNSDGQVYVDYLDEQDDNDFEQDITCKQCQGRGIFAVVVGPDEVEKSSCSECNGLGYCI